MKDVISFIKTNKIFIILLISITFLSYANVLRGEFVTADDFPGIVNNPLVKDLRGSIESMSMINIKNALIFYFFGMNSSAYHFIGITLHLINVFLVFLFVGQIFDNSKVAKISALIFALHPVNTEAIMWISGNPYAMITTFALLIFLFYSIYENTSNIIYLVLAIVTFFTLILLDRGAWVLIIPMVLLLVNQFIYTEKFDIKRSFIVIPFLLLAILSAFNLIDQSFRNRVDELENRYYFNQADAPPYFNRTTFSIFLATRYYLFPYELNIYPGERVLSNTEVNFVYVFALLFTILTLYLLIKHRLYAGLILIIIASVAPVFSPIQVAWIMSERYLYLGSIFFSILVSLILLKNKNFAKNHLNKTLVLIAVICIIRVLLRSEDWTTNKKLWYSTLRFSPDSYRVYNNLGDVYIKENDFDKAKEYFEMSFKVFPSYADAMHNLGMVYMLEEDFENAEKYMQMAVATNPNLAVAYEKMGLIYFNKGEIPEAYNYSVKALNLDPNLPYAQNIINSIDNQ